MKNPIVCFKTADHGPVRGIHLTRLGNALRIKYGSAIPIPTIMKTETPRAVG